MTHFMVFVGLLFLKIDGSVYVLMKHTMSDALELVFYAGFAQA